MRSRPVLILSFVLVVLVGAAVGLYAYDQGGRDTIPKGVTVAGVDVGGLDAGSARAKLEREYVSRLRTPVRVDHGSLTFTLSPDQSRVRADLGAMIDAAVERADDGNLLSRSWRRLTGGKVHADIRPIVTYSHSAVASLVDQVGQAVDRDPIDAKVTFSAAGLQVRAGREGLTVLTRDLQRRIERAVGDPAADHTLVARTRHITPARTTKDIAAEYGTALVVDRSNFTLKLYKEFKLVKRYAIGVGMVGLETPAGLYHIQNKAVNPAWTEPNSSWVPKADRGKVVPGGTPENPLKARWLGIYDGAGIHGVDPSEYSTIGKRASHGCVRMRIPDVIDLYDRVPVGAPIYIA